MSELNECPACNQPRDVISGHPIGLILLGLALRRRLFVCRLYSIGKASGGRTAVCQWLAQGAVAGLWSQGCGRTSSSWVALVREVIAQTVVRDGGANF